MTHIHSDETETIETLNVDNASPARRPSAGHMNLKPTVVFDHIKAKVKVKGKRSLNNIPSDAQVFAIDRNHADKRSAGQHQVVKPKHSLLTTFSQSVDVINRGSKESLENQLSPASNIYANDNHEPLNSIEKEKQIDELARWRFEFDNNNNNTNHFKLPTSKSKINRMSKTTAEQDHRTSRKTRRTLQSPSKRDSVEILEEDFHKIFKELPVDEQLITTYTCAWRKDIFMHGRLFLTLNHLCFYTSFLKWEDSLCVAYKDIDSVTREKSAKLIPNAIQLRMKTREQYLFASYNQRERIFIGIFRLWQNALLENPLGHQQLKGIVFADQMNINESTGDSDDSLPTENNNEQILPKKSTSVSPDRESLAQLNEIDEETFTMNLLETPVYRSSCSCDHHLAKIYAERAFTIPVDQLFDLAFGENTFSRTYHESQNLIDYAMAPWVRNNATGKRERQVTYKTVVSSILGTNTITCAEKQTMESEQINSIYVLTSEVFNEGMKYTDSFYVTTKFCMYQQDVKHAFLRVTAEVRYVKAVNAIARAFIEKNSYSNIEDGVDNLVRRLENYQTTKNNSKFDDKSRKHSHKKKFGRQTSFDDKHDEHSPLINNEIIIQQRPRTQNGYICDYILLTAICILILHVYLCYKLYYFDQILSNRDNHCEIVCRKTSK